MSDSSLASFLDSVVDMTLAVDDLSRVAFRDSLSNWVDSSDGRLAPWMDSASMEDVAVIGCLDGDILVVVCGPFCPDILDVDDDAASSSFMSQTSETLCSKS